MPGQDSPHPSSPSDSITRALNLLAALLGLIYLGWALWSMIPEHQRKEWMLGLHLSCARVMTITARRVGAGQLAREAITGQANYWLPLHLGLARDWLLARYERMTL